MTAKDQSDHSDKTCSDLEFYRLLVDLMKALKFRMEATSAVFLIENTTLVLFSSWCLSRLAEMLQGRIFVVNAVIVGLILCVGITSCFVWAALAVRLQMKLRLRYFQARYTERQLAREGWTIFSDEKLYYNPRLKGLESPDGVENLGFAWDLQCLTKLFGYRFWSTFLPAVFTIIYLVQLGMLLFLAFT